MVFPIHNPQSAIRNPKWSTLMFNPAAYENSRPDGIAVLEIIPDEPGTEEPRLFVPLKRTELGGEVIGPLAHLRLTQVYGYSREQCDRVLEAVYRFPLPGDAAVSGVRVCFGDVEIVAQLKEREKAERQYEEAKRAGRQAALATRESPDVFTLQVAGIQPDQEVRVETSYVQLARPEGRGWSLRVPLTTSPRYVRSDEAGSRHAQGQPLLLLRDPGHRFSMELSVRNAASLRSATHALEVTEGEEGARVRLQEGEVLPDRDCVLSWEPQGERDRPALRAILHHDPEAEQVYFLAQVAPPAVHDPDQSVPREVILLVDHSGSMEGAKWNAADWAVKQFLSGLTERDSFTLALFHSQTRWFSQKLRRADAGAVRDAIEFLEKHRDSGGTELGVALEQALHIPRERGDLARHLLIVTDAEVSDEGRILRLADEESRERDRRRISVLCIDAAPNSFLAHELAERGGGVARFLTSAPEEEDITTALDEILADWAEPVLAGLRLEVGRPQVEASSREVLRKAEAGWSAVDLGDLPAGRSIWVAGRAPRGEGGDLSFRLAAGEQKMGACRIPLAAEIAAHPGLKALFGARRVLGLEFLINSGYSGENLRKQLERLGYDPDEVLSGQSAKRAKLYAENTREDAKAALQGLLVREALEYGLASSETAFIAVRKEAGKPVEGTVAVANALPSGWSDRFQSLGFHTGGMAGGMPRMASFMASSLPSIAAPAPDLMDLASGVMESVLGDQTRGIQAAPGASPPSDIDIPPFLRDRSMRQTGGRPPAKVDLAGKSEPLFSGVPQFTNGEAVLFDTSRAEDAARLADHTTLTRLRVRFPGGAPRDLDTGLTLLLYVDDLASPRARVRLADVVRQGGTRPLNLTRLPGQAVRVVLTDPAGSWASSAPQLEIELS
jgi:Ca-activated chloride channel homolog